jgi:hypothetical protein
VPLTLAFTSNPDTSFPIIIPKSQNIPEPVGAYRPELWVDNRVQHGPQVVVVTEVNGTLPACLDDDGRRERLQIAIRLEQQ